MSLIFETVQTEGIAELSYLIGDDVTGTAAVIDPRPDVEIYLELAKRRKVAITHIFETHIHADLVSGSRELAARSGTARDLPERRRGGEVRFRSSSDPGRGELRLRRARPHRSSHAGPHPRTHVVYRGGKETCAEALGGVLRRLPLRQFRRAPGFDGRRSGGEARRAAPRHALLDLPDARRRRDHLPGPRPRLSLRRRHRRPPYEHHRLRTPSSTRSSSIRTRRSSRSSHSPRPRRSRPTTSG